MEPHLAVSVDLLEEALEQLDPVSLSMAGGIISLSAQDFEELRAGLEEATALTDGLEGAVEADWPCAVTIPQETPMLGGNATHVRSLQAGRQWLGVGVAGFDRLGHSEVLLCDRAVRDARIG